MLVNVKTLGGFCLRKCDSMFNSTFRSRLRGRRKLTVRCSFTLSFQKFSNRIGDRRSRKIYLCTKNILELSMGHCPIFSWVCCFYGYLLLGKGY